MTARRRRRAVAPDELREFCADAYPRIAGSLALYTGDRGLAEELAQDTFVKVCREWETVRAHPNPMAWTHTVAFNLARSRFRRRKAQKRAVDRTGNNVRASLANTAALPDEADVLAVREAVDALPEDQRAVVALRFFGGLTIDETAEALKVPAGTVKSRTTRAVDSLRSAGLVVSPTTVSAVATPSSPSAPKAPVSRPLTIEVLA